jgi:hypothetical protein
VCDFSSQHRVQNGRSEDETRRHYELVDRKIFERIQTEQHKADLVLNFYECASSGFKIKL